MRIIILVWVLLCATAGSIPAQDARLAQEYFQNGEYEKAATLYERLYSRSDNTDYYFDRYVESLIALEQFDKVEDVIRTRLKKYPDNLRAYVALGQMYESQYRDEEAQKAYRQAIENLPANNYEITKLANAFMALNKYDLAIEAFERGARMLKDNQVFAYNLGDLYRRKGDSEKMITNYLNALANNPSRLGRLESIFQRYLSKDDFEELKRQLYTRIQENGNALYYPELLTWVFVQEENYSSALRQVRAIDRRLNENGGRVFKLAQIAASDGDYETAIDAYLYIVERKGPQSSYYLEAKREALRCQRNLIIEGYQYTEAELMKLRAQYEAFFDDFGRNKLTAPIILEFAELEAIYINNLPKAIGLLQELIEYPNVDLKVQARGKIRLADYYLMRGEVWEATLLYSQVDKAFKEDQLGHEARFRNARLSYYAGDFQWAQAQFDVLKASTSKLIANDALDMSVFIMDNLGLDSTTAALELYAKADLLVFQNRFDEAFEKLDTLAMRFGDHSLADDVLYLKARVFKKTGNYQKAAAHLQQIIDNHPEEIRADNALFQLAELYENQLDDTEKAKSLYETLFIDFSNSTFAVEARKRYRRLRGDDV